MSISTAHMPYSVRTIHESSGDLLSPPIFFTSQSTPAILFDSETKINTNCISYNKNIHHKMEQQASMKSSKSLASLPPDCIKKIYLEEGPSEGTVAHHVLEKKVGFSYRKPLSKCMYAYITCRPNIGYTITTLSKFSSAPLTYHYQLSKGVTKYLRSTIHYGVRFRRKSLLNHPEFEPSEWYTIPDDNGFT